MVPAFQFREIALLGLELAGSDVTEEAEEVFDVVDAAGDDTGGGVVTEADGVKVGAKVGAKVDTSEVDAEAMVDEGTGVVGVAEACWDVTGSVGEGWLLGGETGVPEKPLFALAMVNCGLAFPESPNKTTM